jgi:hypothetical protein
MDMRRVHPHFLQFKKVGMLQGSFARDPPIGIILKQFVQELGCIVGSQCLLGDKLRDIVLRPQWKLWIVVRQAQDGRPHFGRGRSTTLKYFEQLINVTASWKERHACGHFGKDASNAPNIDGCRIAIGTQ